MMDSKELKNVLAQHNQWLQGKGGKRADLSGADLQEAKLRGANLQGADLRAANLQGANLQEADLRGANLWWANLQGARLRRASLQLADLQGADLQGADLRGADLQGASLQEAKLEGARLRRANLEKANFGNIRILQIGPIGSRKDYLTWKYGPNIDEVSTGCWIGSMKEFVDAIQHKHGINTFAQEYQAVVQLLISLKAIEL